MIDEIDRAIIRELERDGRQSVRVLGAAVGLSPNATGVRLTRLLESGVISGIHASVDHSQLGRPMEVSVDCRLRDPDDRGPISDLVAADDRVVEAFHLTGRVDYRLRVFVASPGDLDDLLTSLRSRGGVADTDSRIVLHRLAT